MLAFDTPAHWTTESSWLFLVWLVAVGASIGSFMNVVVYRLPAGLSIVRPASRCPRCLHPIRGYDNLPVISWFLLRGKCRDCGAPIAARYPLVEATVAVITVLVALAELFPLDSLPTAWRPHGRAVLTGTAAWAGFASHLLVLLTLLCGALMQWDGKPVPARLFNLAIVGSLVAVVLYPETSDFPPSKLSSSLPSVLRGVLAGVAGCGLGSLIGRFVAPADQRTHSRLILGLSLMASGFAWGFATVLVQAAAVVLALAVSKVSGRPDHRSVPPLAAALGAALTLTLVTRWWC